MSAPCRARASTGTTPPGSWSDEPSLQRPPHGCRGATDGPGGGSLRNHVGPREGRRQILPSPIFLLIVALAVAGGVLAWEADLHSTLARIGVFVLVVSGWIVSVCLHEFAHAY